MLVFNLRRVLKMRGFDRVYSYLMENGFTHTTASKLATGNVPALKIKSIGKLCRLLNCTPNDLYEWQPDAKDPLPENHALNQIVRVEIPLNLKNLLKDIPLERMSEAENLLKALKDG